MPLVSNENCLVLHKLINIIFLHFVSGKGERWISSLSTFSFTPPYKLVNMIKRLKTGKYLLFRILLSFWSKFNLLQSHWVSSIGNDL